jgi:hypothetical protein
MPNARDEQIIRQTVLKTTAKGRDLQVFRQSVVKTTAKARDLQVFRQTILLRGSSTPAIVCFCAT